MIYYPAQEKSSEIGTFQAGGGEKSGVFHPPSTAKLRKAVRNLKAYLKTRDEMKLIAKKNLQNFVAILNTRPINY